MSISLGTAIAAYQFGHTLGEAMVVNFNREVCEMKISELEGLIGRLAIHQSKLENLKNRIPAFWEDDRAEKVIAALNRTMADVSKKMITAKDLVATYKSAMQSMESSESKATELLEDAWALLEALG